MTQRLDSFFEWIWDVFTSVKLTVVILTLWLFGSILGTLIVQNEPVSRYVAMYGPKLTAWMFSFHLYDVYHAPWYLLILVLLALNLLGCMLKAWPVKWKLMTQVPRRRVLTDRAGKLTDSRRFHCSHEELEALKARLESRYGSVEDSTDEGVRHLFAQKQAGSHMSFFVLHIGFIVVVLGGLVSLVFGVDAFMSIEEGTSDSLIYQRKGQQMVPYRLDFSVRCDGFALKTDERGRPLEYVSDLVILQDGQERTRQSIEVNSPLHFEGWNLYQSSYEELVRLKVVNTQTGEESRVSLSPQNPQFAESIRMRLYLLRHALGSPMGNSALLQLEGPDGQMFRYQVAGDAARTKERNGQLGEMIAISFADDKLHYATGLQVVKDPGAILVWIGCGLFILALYLTFYLSHRRLWMQWQDGILRVNGIAQRNMPMFRKELDALFSGLGEKK